MKRAVEVIPINSFTSPLWGGSGGDHPDHVRFVKERWKKEVDDFLEIDYTPA